MCIGYFPVILALILLSLIHIFYNKLGMDYKMFKTIYEAANPLYTGDGVVTEVDVYKRQYRNIADSRRKLCYNIERTR